MFWLRLESYSVISCCIRTIKVKLLKAGSGIDANLLSACWAWKTWWIILSPSCRLQTTMVRSRPCTSLSWFITFLSSVSLPSSDLFFLHTICIWQPSMKLRKTNLLAIYMPISIAWIPSGTTLIFLCLQLGPRFTLKVGNVSRILLSTFGRVNSVAKRLSDQRSFNKGVPLTTSRQFQARRHFLFLMKLPSKI